ncbi:sulfotransferase [Kordiimonas sp.]|uniref:sulfotransferase n=1 Tax=Kordiimonas sp. TaxID=1970157 RepID=UPI003A8CAB42
MTPSDETMTPPVIILGVHRSGTSLLTRMMEALGLFVGHDLQGDHESRIFIQVNNKFFEKTQSSWDRPAYPTQEHIDANVIGGIVKANLPQIRASFGPMNAPWGFKDPRTVTTLPLWKRLFPNAKIVYITRSPFDIAQSLTKRHNELIERGIFPRSGDFSKGNVRFTQRCATVEGSLSFALEQVDFIDRLKEGGTANPCLQLSYEGLLRDPSAELRRIVRFIGLSPDRDALTAAAAMPTNQDAVKLQNVAGAYFPALSGTP